MQGSGNKRSLLHRIVLSPRATWADRATALLFLLYLLELGLAYLPLADMQRYFSVLEYVVDVFPALRIPVTAEAKAYMGLTLTLLPVKMLLLFAVEWWGRKYFDFMPLPWGQEKAGFKMGFCVMALVIFTVGAAYFSLGNGVADLSFNTFLSEQYAGLEIWIGWVVYRLSVLGFLLTMLVFTAVVWIARPERNS